MARKPKVTEEALAKLGADRLATLLLAEAGRNRQVKRDLELALEAGKGTSGLVASIRKRLTVIGRSRAGLLEDKAQELLDELVRLKARIINDVAATAPDEALELLWQFIDLHGDIIERTYDRSGRVGAVFRDGCGELGEIAERAKPRGERFAEQVFARVIVNSYGVLDDLIKETAVGLGSDGLTALRELLLAARDERLAANKGRERQAAQYDHTLSSISLALRDVADCQGDVDAYMDAHAGRDPSNPAFAAEIAIRLVAAGRAGEALSVLDVATPSESNRFFREEEWTAARVIALDKLGSGEEAQALRWTAFERFLSQKHLRDYLKRLADFADVEAEEKALTWVEQHPSFHSALVFLIGWSALARAARLVETRTTEIDGDRYKILNPAATALEGKHPVAAVLLRRALIGVSLGKARSSRYRHAARHVLELESLHHAIGDYGRHETHAAFMARLKREHARKHGFWSLVE